MLQTRVIPVLLLKDNGLVKTVRFKEPKYVGDPINAIKIFNDKEVDELIFLDIQASKKNKMPDFKLIQKVASECFMPICYGGGISSIDQMKKIFELGVEKVAINCNALSNSDLIKQAVDVFGSQSIVVSVDVKKSLFGKYKVFNHKNKRKIKTSLVNYLKEIEKSGAGEVLLNSVDQDGMQSGYDIELLRLAKSILTIPIIACGGAKDINDFKIAKEQSNVSGFAAGSMFVFHGKHKAVLISYPAYKQLRKIFGE